METPYLGDSPSDEERNKARSVPWMLACEPPEELNDQGAPFIAATPKALNVVLTTAWSHLRGASGQQYDELYLIDTTAPKTIGEAFWQGVADSRGDSVVVTSASRLSKGSFNFKNRIFIERSYAGHWGKWMNHVTKEESKSTQGASVVVQAFGNPNRAPCKSCEETWLEGNEMHSTKPYIGCVSLDGQWKGACANCLFGGKGTSCTFRKDPWFREKYGSDDRATWEGMRGLGQPWVVGMEAVEECGKRLQVSFPENRHVSIVFPAHDGLRQRT